MKLTGATVNCVHWICCFLHIGYGPIVRYVYEKISCEFAYRLDKIYEMFSKYITQQKRSVNLIGAEVLYVTDGILHYWYDVKLSYFETLSSKSCFAAVVKTQLAQAGNCRFGMRHHGLQWTPCVEWSGNDSNPIPSIPNFSAISFSNRYNVFSNIWWVILLHWRK